MEKVDLYKGCRNPLETDGVAIRVSSYLALNLNKNADISNFLKMRESKGYLFVDFHRIRPDVQKSKHIYKDLKTTWSKVT